jgi:hypothetical protein
MGALHGRRRHIFPGCRLFSPRYVKDLACSLIDVLELGYLIDMLRQARLDAPGVLHHVMN